MGKADCRDKLLGTQCGQQELHTPGAPAWRYASNCVFMSLSAELSVTPIGNAREKSILPHVFCRRNGERTYLNGALAVFSERSAPCKKQLQKFDTQGMLSEFYWPPGGETSSLSQSPLQKRKCGMLAHTSLYQSVRSMCVTIKSREVHFLV